MKKHTELYRARSAQFILCQLIESLEEHLIKLDDKYGPITFEEIAMFSSLAELKGNENYNTLQSLPEHIIGTTPNVVRCIRRSNS